VTSQKYIDENSTESLMKGDKVVMHSCWEAQQYCGRIWICLSDVFEQENSMGPNFKLVYLEGFELKFRVEFLRKV
jgi:hypothetical protein